MVRTRAKAREQTTAYRYLEARPHPWRQQWWLKGRNMTVGQLIYSMRAGGWLADPAGAAQNFDLPVEQVHEALEYYRQHCSLIEHEADEEKRWLIEHGAKLEPSR
jgi:uncharacterized protein (DUF433 family)